MIETMFVINSQSLERRLAIGFVDLLVGGMRVKGIENRVSKMSENGMVWTYLRKGHLRG